MENIECFHPRCEYMRYLEGITPNDLYGDICPICRKRIENTPIYQDDAEIGLHVHLNFDTINDLIIGKIFNKLFRNKDNLDDEEKNRIRNMMADLSDLGGDFYKEFEKIIVTVNSLTIKTKSAYKLA